MKILSPLDSADEVEKLADAGADEFYCGLLEEQWYEKYPVISINRRPAGKGHFKKFLNLKKAVTAAHALRIPVYFTLNEHYYINAQYALITKYIEGALDAGVDAFIVSDYGLIAFIKEQKYDIPLHISTGGTVFNWRAVRFYKKLGAVNITFPRHLTIEEIQDIVSVMPHVATTVFILNSRCVNVDGFCTFQHGLAGKKIPAMFRNACMLPFEVSVYKEGAEQHELSFTEATCMVERQKTWEKVHVDDYPCGACAIYEFKNIGIGSLKIVGRGNPSERKIRDIAYIKSILNFIDVQGMTKKQFREASRTLYASTYNRTCRLPMCYYPEVMLE